MRLPLYFDYASTAPVDAQVIAKMHICLGMENIFGNPASNTHAYGTQARELIEEAREQVACLVNAEPKEIIFTSGATESNNLAIQGVAYFYRNKGQHIITAKTEHKAVLDTCKYLEKQGFEVTYLEPEKNGLLDIASLHNAMRNDTILVSIMHVNNEIGVIQDIQSIGQLCRNHKIIFHVDAAQSAGKIPIDLQNLPVDLMSFSAHKVYGPKGVGALFVRRKPRICLQPIIHGGGHEQGLRSGTLATHQIVGMGEAFRIANEELLKEQERLLQLRNHLWNQLKLMPGISLNGDWQQRVPGILNFSVAGVDGGALIQILKDIAVSTSSACTSAAIEPSHVLQAIGVSDALAHSSLRISIGRYTTKEEIDFAIKHIKEGIERLRSLSPVWCS